MYKRWLIVCSLMLCLGGAVAHAAAYDEVAVQAQIDQLQLGMDYAAVEAIMGAPETRLTRGKVARWDYGFGAADDFTIWFGEHGLRNAYGGTFSTFHLVTPPEGYLAPKTFDVESDPNRQIETTALQEQVLSESDSIFTPILPEKSIRESVERWRLDRESRNYQRYAKNYTADYASSTRLTHKQWLQQLRKSMSKTRFIKVSVDQIKTEFVHSKKVLVEFVQVYQSNRYSDRVKKRLQYEYMDSQWLITKEQTLAKL